MKMAEMENIWKSVKIDEINEHTNEHIGCEENGVQLIEMSENWRADILKLVFNL